MKKLIFLSLLLSCMSAQAMTTYQYVGNNFNDIKDVDPPAGTYTTLMKVTASFTVDAALEPMSLTSIDDRVTSYSFNDGRNTINDSTSGSQSFFSVAVDESGLISDWRISASTSWPLSASVGDTRGLITTAKYFVGGFGNFWVVRDEAELTVCVVAGTGGSTCNVAANDFGRVSDNPGTWSIIPIPAAAWLFGSALGLLGWMRRKAA